MQRPDRPSLAQECSEWATEITPISFINDPDREMGCDATDRAQFVLRGGILATA